MEKKNKLYKELLALITNGASYKKIIEYINRDDTVYTQSYIASLLECIELLKAENLEQYTGLLYYCLGCIDKRLDNKYNALNYYIKALDIFKKTDSLEYLAYTYYKISDVLSRLCEYKASNEVILKGITHALEGNNNDVLCSMLIKFCTNLIITNQYSEADELLNYIMKEYKSSTNNIENKFKIQIIKTYIEANIGDVNKAFSYIKNITKEMVCEDRKKYIIFIAIACSECYIRIKNYKYAEGCLLFCYKKIPKDGISYYVSFTLCRLIDLSILQKDYNKYYEYTTQLLEFSEKNHEETYIWKSYNYLYNYYKLCNNYEKSLSYLEKYNYNEAKNKKVNEFNQILNKLDINIDNTKITLNRIIDTKTKIVSEFGQKLISILDMDNIYTYLSKEIKNILKNDVVILSLYNHESGMVNLYMGYDDDGALIKVNMENNPDKNIPTFKCINKGQNILINDFYSEKSYYDSKYSIEKLGITQPLSMIYVPIIYDKNILGCISVQSLNKNEYGLHDVNMLKIIASYLSVAIENANNYKIIENKAVYDSLTGFLTKGEIINIGNKLANEYKITNTPFCIFMIDLNNFSLVNDTYGHLSGDLILKTLAQSVKRTVRKGDYIGRFGGDEILIISPNLTTDKGEMLADRIKNNVKNTTFLTTENVEIDITISIGIYEYNDSSIKFIDAIKNADKKLYIDKNIYKSKQQTNV